MTAARVDLARIVTDDIYHRLLESLPSCAPLAGFVAQSTSFLFVRAWRARLVANAARALGPGSTRGQQVRCAYRMLGAMQRSIADIFASKDLTSDQLCSKVADLDGSADYLAARELGRGAVIAGVHMGAFEPALAMLCRHERRVHVLFQPDPMPRFERARQGLRRRLGVIEHRISDGVAAWSELLDALHADEAVVLHADCVMPGQHGAKMPFLGDPEAHLPTGPVRLAAAAGAPIIPTFCARTNRGFRVWSDGVIPAPTAPITSRESAAHPAQRALVAAMERAIRAHPDQWMAFMDLREAPAPQGRP
ncbi:MAG: lysophospholipid acyltransferase family protein [Planctomycetes bacterium]|nr:lysophospholipid acyltransferase family protein [Planctomycetota bacterium]